jgi:hypothetical protein
MILRSPAEHENGGFSSLRVIPAQAGIHPHPSLDTGFRRYDGPRPTTPCSYFCAGIFEGGHEEHEVQKKKFFSSNLCALATLREIFRNLVAALPRWAFVV